MAYGEPILQIYTSDPTASDNRAVPFIITDDNRSPLALTYERIEQSSRMADGTMRRFITANKRKIATSWENIPAAGGSNYTSDGYLSGAFLKSFFEENVYNPIWIKLTYSEEAWRAANSSTPTDRYGYINRTYSKTISNTDLPKEVVIEDVGAGRVSASVGLAYVVTKTDHGITPGDEIYVRGLSQPFNGTWVTSSTATFADVMTNTYDSSIIRSNPALYLKLDSASIVDSGASSATFNSSSSNLASASGLSASPGVYSNTQVSSDTSYTVVTGSTSNLPRMALEKAFTVEFWHKGTSDPSLNSIDIIRKLPSNLISNSNFNSNVEGWSFSPPAQQQLDGPDRSFERDTYKKLTGTAAGKMTLPSSSSTSASVYYEGIPVTASETYSLSGFINWTDMPFFGAASVSFTTVIQWMDSSNNILSSSSATSASLAPLSWNRVSVTGTAPTSATSARAVFVKNTGKISCFHIDNTLFEKSSTVKDYTGWAIQRLSNDKIKFEVYPYRGIGAKIIVPNMYDNEWHHIAFRASLPGGEDTSSLTMGDLKIDAWVDGELYDSEIGSMKTFQGFSAPHDYFVEPIRINHAINSGMRDNIAVYDKREPENALINRSKMPEYYYSIPESRALVFYYNQDGNPPATFSVNSYKYEDNEFTFNVDSTQLINIDDTFRLYNFKPASGSVSFDSASIRFIVTGKEDDNSTTFSASPYWSATASPVVTGNGNGYGGYGVLVSSYPMMRSLPPTAQPVIGTAVASDVIKAFITSFDYTINKRFTLTDYVDVSIEFTEI